MYDFDDFVVDANVADDLSIPEPPVGDMQSNLCLARMDVADKVEPGLINAGFSLNRRETDRREIEIKSESTTEITDGKCYALMGASGGAGVTSLCIQIAFDMTKRAKKSVAFWQNSDPTVCLIDLDFETGTCASYLNIEPSMAIEDICGPANRIDGSSLQALVSRHESGLAVLATPNGLGANSRANPEAILALLDAAVQQYEHVIIDLPRIWLPWVAAAISGADHFALVGELNVASLQSTRTRMTDIEKALGDAQSCEVILNKVERRSFRSSIRLPDAEKALRRSVSAAICVDLDTTREAINCGVAVEAIRPEARYVKDVAKLSRLWAPVQGKVTDLTKDRRRKRAEK